MTAVNQTYLLALALLFTCVSCTTSEKQIHLDKELPFVVVAYDDTGDFGPATTGTQTSGIQEAIDYCVTNSKDLYIKGGFGGRKPVYHISKTIRIPAAQDFKIDGGVYVINYVGDKNKDALSIDSAMNCEYRLGMIVYGGKKAGLRIQPKHNVPIDGFPAFIESKVTSHGIADPQPFVAGEREFGTGLVIDTEHSAVSYCQFEFSAVLNFETNIEIKGKRDFFSNEFKCSHLHTNSHNSTLMKIGRNCVANQLRLGIGVDQGATNVAGISLTGKQNSMDVSTRPGGFRKNHQIVFESESAGNSVCVLAKENAWELVTDHSDSASNRLSWTGSPAPSVTLETTVDQYEYTQRLYPALISLSKLGEAKVFRIRNGKKTVIHNPIQEFRLEAGDRMRLVSSQKHILNVTPIK